MSAQYSIRTTNIETEESIMAQINNNERCCATCVEWLGSRVPNRLGYVEVASKMVSGRCAAKGLNESREYQACYSCRNYCKWSALQ